MKILFLGANFRNQDVEYRDNKIYNNYTYDYVYLI